MAANVPVLELGAYNSGALDLLNGSAGMRGGGISRAKAKIPMAAFLASVWAYLKQGIQNSFGRASLM